ncbi:type IV pilus assembly protein FimV [Quatrionicoccus australiensis]|uniref:type IV pilus assembly protein FimV n=1 Tax=Quatrionicoccus australiensis TaxID=138118 RepID=UPI001CF96805|nr:hypothetical protein [Quatrionicoccus australiensis]MCB4360998.1 hypothetical protein [Quatrionicoccus australiensis]
MTPEKILLQAILLALCSSEASAIGLGEITLHSRLGESLRADIPLHTADGEIPDATCFAVVRDDAPGLPVLATASLSLVRKAGTYHLSLRSRQPIADPAFVLAIKARCSMELQRTYVLMPDPPQFGEIELVSNAVDMVRPADGQTWFAREGETLREIAASLAAGNPRQQARSLAALRRANPGIARDEALPEGTAILLRAPRRPQAESRTKSELTAIPPAPATRTRQAAARSKAPRTAAKVDRVMVSTTPPAPVPNPLSATGETLGQIEERILKLEQTLHTLHAEVSKLDVALNETNAALLERNRLQLAQQIEQVPPTNQKQANGGQELLFSALAGGGIAVLLAHLLGRRRERLVAKEMPLIMNGYHPEVQVDRSGLPESPSRQPEPSTERAVPDIGVAELPFDENNTELALVEMLLASGRARGAMETLARYIANNSPDDIEPWKMLLDLYRQCGMQSEYESLHRQILEKFKIRVADWETRIEPAARIAA